MAPIKNPRAYLKASVDSGSYPVPNEHLAYDEEETIDLDCASLNGGILVKTLCVSLDPYMRGRMRGAGESYSMPWPAGKAIVGGLVAKILRTENPQYNEGQLIVTYAGYQLYNVLPKDHPGIHGLPELKVVSPSAFLGVLGMPGRTAYCGLKEYGKLKKGETLFVSTGAGAVGSLVIQLAKAEGLKVIGSAGSDDKVAYMKECGADVAFNYKTAKTADILKEHGGIDVYWDNVGGETLNTVIPNMNTFGRIIVCGFASEYNNKPFPITNLSQVIPKRITIVGFLVLDIQAKYFDEFYTNFAPKVAKGEIKFKEEIYEGLQKTPEALDDLLRGKNSGKVVVQVST